MAHPRSGAADNMQHATCNVQHATCNMQHATCHPRSGATGEVAKGDEKPSAASPSTSPGSTAVPKSSHEPATSVFTPFLLLLLEGPDKLLEGSSNSPPIWKDPSPPLPRTRSCRGSDEDEDEDELPPPPPSTKLSTCDRSLRSAGRLSWMRRSGFSAPRRKAANGRAIGVAT